MKSKKRDIDLVVLSDIHLGTYGCHAKELLIYLKSINPKKVVLNGDIIDIWQFNKHYWPTSHMLVVKYLLGLVAKGVKVYYITGNHDEMLRKFSGFKMGSLEIVNKLILQQGKSKLWIFHGDVFDVTMQNAKWLAKLGSIGYDASILINRVANFISQKLGYGKISLSKKIKNSVKSAVKFINSFERTAADIGISNGYQYVICGHIHQPEMREMNNEDGSIIYMNSGDWIENLTSLECTNEQWSIYKYHEDLFSNKVTVSINENETLNSKQLFANLVSEFAMMNRA
ncbi:MAG TPA: UDP-2,3-diacylglucosamine diphosphatase [Chitinophagaceae bacterium]|nr:UDP-2,3-diacylglucosamine diphosphatase [Chitinophagaceae bacterium]